jgi:hypothetical protein
MWSQREKGALVASGVAVVQMNPWGGDAWDAGLAAPDFPGWGPGPDLPAFEKLFEALNAGSLGEKTAAAFIQFSFCLPLEPVCIRLSTV